jgi:hypothetical protein
MPWEIGWTKAERSPESITPTEVLYQHDEPMLFVSSMGFFDALCSKIDEDEDSGLYLICPTSDRLINAVKNGMVSLRGAMSAPNYWIVQADEIYRVMRAWTVSASELPEDLLPKKSYGLFPEFGRLPDTIEQAQAFFSMKFSGKELHADRMSFQIFRDLVDSAYSATKSLITPHLLNGYRSNNVFNMPIAQPTFSSLAISVMQPDMDISVINSRYSKKTTYTKADIVQASRNRREEFFDRAGEVVEEASKGDIPVELAANNFDWLETLLEVSPNPHRHIEDVEFNAKTPVGRSYLHIGEEVGKKIRRAYDAAAVTPITMKGVIVEINDDSSTFIIRNFQTQRQVTCILPVDLYAELDRTGSLSRGSKLELRGSFERRSRRDKLTVTSKPAVIP